MSDQPCAWCGKPAVVRRELEPTTKARLFPITAWVCDEHCKMVDRNIERRGLQRELQREKRKQLPDPTLVAELERAIARLS